MKDLYKKPLKVFLGMQSTMWNILTCCSEQSQQNQELHGDVCARPLDVWEAACAGLVIIYTRACMRAHTIRPFSRSAWGGAGAQKKTCHLGKQAYGWKDLESYQEWPDAIFRCQLQEAWRLYNREGKQQGGFLGCKLGLNKKKKSPICERCFSLDSDGINFDIQIKKKKHWSPN